MLTQTSNPLPLILLFTVIGFLIGALVAYLATRGSVNSAVQKELEVLRQRDQQLRELMGFTRERATRKLMVWFGGKIVLDSKQLSEAQRQQMEANGREFLAWLGVAPPAAAPVSSPAPAAPPAAPDQPLLTPELQAAAQPRLSQTGPLRSSPPVLPLVTPAVEEKKVEKPLSIVEQINAILQEMLPGSPLENRGISLVEDPRNGVVVWVGLEHFAGVDAVADPQIKEALRAAASEWERRMERNRR